MRPQVDAIAQSPSRGATALLSGMMWMSSSNMLVRVVTFAGQIVVGWLLAPEDLGIWALALSISTVVQALRNGGTSQILINRGGDYEAQAGKIYRFALMFNAIAMLVLLIAAALYCGSHPALAVVLAGIALSLPIGTPAMVLKAKLTIERRFRELAAIGLGSAIVWQTSVAVLAFCKLGAMSFALPPILQALYETVASRRSTGKIPSQTSKATRADYWQIFRQSRWVMLSAGALGLATTGGYFAVAMLADARTTGLYFFAFQLVVAVSGPLYGAMEVVLPPLLTQLNENRARQVEACARSSRAIIAASIPAAAAFALVAPSLMHFIWHGKWDAAAPIAQILAACMPAWLLVSTGRALIEARGLWRTRFIVLGVYGFGGMGATAFGALIGGIDAIAFSVTAFYIAFAVAFVLVLKGLGLPLRDMVAFKDIWRDVASVLTQRMRRTES